MALTEFAARAAFEDIMDRLGVRAGDRIMLAIDMGNLPLPTYPATLSRDAFRARQQKWCDFVLRMLLDRVGRAGTILAPAFSYACTEPGSTFTLEATPAETGPLTEFLRSQPEAVRSIHPIFSLAGIGADAVALLGACGRAAFGMGSPFGRFSEFGVRFLCLGVELRRALTYVHHLEQLYGCPHRFNKTFDTEVFAQGRSVPGPWYAYLQYRGFEYTSDISRLQNSLKADGSLAEADWNGRTNQLADVQAVDRVGCGLLSENSSAFIDRAIEFQFDESLVVSLPPSERATLVVSVTGSGPGD